MVLIFKSLYFGRVWWLTDFNSFYLGGCGGLERTDFNSFYVGRVWWS